MKVLISHRLWCASAIVGSLAGLAVCATPSAEPAIAIPHPITMLLRAQPVHRELTLSDEQTTAVARFAEEAELPLWRLRDLPAQERDLAAAPILGSLQTKLRGVLAGRQLDRLDQLVLRAQGMRAALEPRVADAVKLTAGQRKQIRAILSSLGRNAAPVDALRRAQAVLSPAQRSVLASLVGRPFSFSGVPQVACQAPEFEGATEWINSPPVTLGQLRGKVVVVHYYAFGCINCIRNLPHYNGWFDRFGRDDVAIVGIHRPETDAERDIEQVRRKVAEAGIRYPVAVDNDSRNWDAWANRVWPSMYLIDRRGFVRYWWYGELNWQTSQGESRMRARIAELVAEPRN
jgi:peroxiredoxin